MLVSRFRGNLIRLWYKWVPTVGILGVLKVVFRVLAIGLLRLGVGGVGTKPRLLESAERVA